MVEKIKASVSYVSYVMIVAMLFIILAICGFILVTLLYLTGEILISIVGFLLSIYVLFIGLDLIWVFRDVEFIEEDNYEDLYN